jgi:hypothetical protein
MPQLVSQPIEPLNSARRRLGIPAKLLDQLTRVQRRNSLIEIHPDPLHLPSRQQHRRQRLPQHGVLRRSGAAPPEPKTVDVAGELGGPRACLPGGVGGRAREVARCG